MKTITDCSKPVQRLWVCHEALRRLGFDAEDIYVSKCIEPVMGQLVDSLCCILESQSKQFIMNCGYYYYEGEIEKALDEWSSFIRDLREVPEEDLMDVFESWPFDQSRVDFIGALYLKGFTIPYLAGLKGN